MQKHENDIARDIVDAAYKIHVRLGPGLLENVYECVLAYELEKSGHLVERQKAMNVHYDGMIFEESFRLDMIVDDLVIVELKAVSNLGAVHRKQTLTYLKLANKRLGLLINFNEALIKDGIHRIANGLTES